ncbi:hypothetical protein O181_030039 [Austropuccinia psidii MF-1]|uniref:Uncharacterized protein n=1 Tax=Austropuccinia psidii MF-1 TaxID=1389203 RepID=A0A9Q3CTB9_9BASI|nr:hypothetical protein [Austropuccinia psidii MF-1]
MDNKRFNLASNWEELEAGFQKIFLTEITFENLLVITKGWNPDRKFKLLEEKEFRIGEIKATIQAIEDKLNQTEHNLIPSGSQRVNQPDSSVALHNSRTSRLVTKIHHSSRPQVLYRKIQGSKGKNKTSFSQRQKESDPMIQKLSHFVKESNKNQKYL